MSIQVTMDQLARTLGDFGAGYLLTTSGDGRVKAVTVEPVPADGTLAVVAPGKGSVANVGANPTVTLLFPPTEPRGYTLLVDGTAEASGDDVRVVPATAVLHRPAAHADGPPPPDGCGNDCQAVG